MTPAPVFASATEALDIVRAGLRFLVAADATGLTAGEQAECLQGLERVTSVAAAARASVLGSFTAGRGYSADADYSPRAWLIHKTGVTRAAAVSYTAWAKRAVAHPRVFAVLAAGEVSESFARTVCIWTDKLPAASRDAADEILMGAAVSGLGLRDLAVLAGEMLARAWQQDRPDPPAEPEDRGGGRPEGDPGERPGGDQDGQCGGPEGAGPSTDGPSADDPGDSGPSDADPDEVFEDRAVRLLVTFQGAGVLHGDLTPECAEIVNTVLDALAAPGGPEDTRDQGQRYHDALQEAMIRLLASGLLPERGGAPVKAWVNVSLADLMMLEGSSALLGEWTSRLRARQAALRAAGCAGRGGDNGGAWLEGDAAEAITCDAVLAPVVTGEVDPDAFDDLVRLCVQLDKLRHGPARAAGDQGAGDSAGEDMSPGSPGSARSLEAREAPEALEALEQAVVGKAAALLSGPGGLASFLRRRQLGARLAGPSLPLDIGYAETVPAHIRNAVRLRDRHCRWAGGCSQPASACEVHHTTHKADGGKTSLGQCVLLCRFHHLIVIHRWGWTLRVNPDGTTTAWNKDKTKILHSHGRNHSPPARAG